MVFKQNRLLPSEGVSLTTSEQVAGFKSHASDPNCEDGEHRMKNGEMSMPTLERVTKAGIASADTIKDELHGVHWKKQGKGAGVDLTMPMSGHGSLGAAESNHADDRGISGLHFSKRKKCDTMSCSDRGKKARGKPRHGRKQSHVLILRDKNSGKTCYSVTNAPMAYYLQHEKRLFKAFNNRLVTIKMKELIDKAKSNGGTIELVVGVYGDGNVITRYKNMPKKLMGRTGLWLTVAEEEPEEIDQITHFPDY